MSAAPRGRRTVLVTGGAGFIGCNLASRLLGAGFPVLLFDNLSRAGVAKNAQWLRDQHRGRVELEVGDVRDAAAVRAAVARVSHVFHLAAQVAVTTSLEQPEDDFDVNARGTLNVLEAARRAPEPPSILFTSTNKVYGALADVPLTRAGRRYGPEDASPLAAGVAEDRPLDFHSPYGCSKGAADQYVLDYARSFGLRAAVFRMSCIYGPHQLGTEDQGWVAHFLIRAIEGQPITIFGDGLQVRDILDVGDLVDAMLTAHARIDDVSGHAFNVGGGPTNTTSLLELIELVAELRGEPPTLAWGPPRTGDQRWYVSDTRKLTRMLGWAPRTPVRDGVRRLYAWLTEARRAPTTTLVEATP